MASAGQAKSVLYVTSYRADGYHFLQTLFQFLDYSDTISIIPNFDGRIRLLNLITGVAEEDDLIVRAARLLHCHYWATGDPAVLGTDIRLVKCYQRVGGRWWVFPCCHRAGGAQRLVELRFDAGHPGATGG